MKHMLLGSYLVPSRVGNAWDISVHKEDGYPKTGDVAQLVKSSLSLQEDLDSILSIM